MDPAQTKTAVEGATPVLELIGKGGVLMIPILLCSVIALALIIERLIFFYSNQQSPEKMQSVFKGLFLEGNNIFSRSHEQPTGPAGRLLQVARNCFNYPKWKFEEALTLAGQEELSRMSKNLRALEVIAAIAPLLGLLGTVVGMIQAFGKVAQHKNQIDPSILAGGIWEALMTTAAGLAVAIPVMVMLHYFDRRMETMSFLLEKFSLHLVHQWDDTKEKARAKAAAPDKEPGERRMANVPGK
ncbi:putative Biopolymer transport protein ExbB [Nitrospina gracilis 3/211]|uniref:Putative Biopolymer transport protein ExbB n=1 Tax=Nitrospina gracilis (strain 3/211) TaxID=1266370 RepID=M1YVM9_NITG3|nr:MULTISPECIES: MotA/TolQ/ExbB proton channel family protein [Nitrospina]MCF8722698.1 biopolymer transport protein ExbB [Nitrospina sp. Nb-3]CCQ89640.1 putative Biopolymer transport protein ExbB [Nitrospina gracilis 3/211]